MSQLWPLACNLIFGNQWPAILASYVGRHGKSNLCFVTPENILLFDFQMFFEGTGRILYRKEKWLLILIINFDSFKCFNPMFVFLTTKGYFTSFHIIYLTKSNYLCECLVFFVFCFCFCCCFFCSYKTLKKFLEYVDLCTTAPVAPHYYYWIHSIEKTISTT